MNLLYKPVSVAWLFGLLAEAGYYDDVKKTASDEAYRNNLLAEFGL